jgi:hypothetical protein
MIHTCSISINRRDEIDQYNAISCRLKLDSMSPSISTIVSAFTPQIMELCFDRIISIEETTSSVYRGIGIIFLIM